MRATIKFYIVCLFTISSVLFSSCDNDNGDTEKPIINLIEPEDGDVLKIGDEHGIHLKMELSDNEMLKSYKVDIHNSFNGHSHSHLKSSERTVDFTFNKSWDISGRNAFIHHHEIKIPANATPGNYHLMVFCTDEAGNESYVARNIVLSY